MAGSGTDSRFAFFRALVVAAFVIVAARLWQLQVVSSQEYSLSADVNRFRLVPVDPPGQHHQEHHMESFLHQRHFVTRLKLSQIKYSVGGL